MKKFAPWLFAIAALGILGFKVVAPAYIVLTGAAVPSAPSSGSIQILSDNTDANRVKFQDSSGALIFLDNPNKGNFLRNSGKWFAQRQTPGTLTTITQSATARKPACDGWAATIENADLQYNRTDTGASKETGLQGKYYGTVKKITNTGKFFLSQCIEGKDCQVLRGRAVRFQLWMKASGNKTIRLAVIQNNSSATEDSLAATFISAVGANSTNPTLGTNLAYVAPLSAGLDLATAPDAQAASCAVTTAWQRFGFCVTAPSDFKNLLVMIYSDSQFAANDTLSWSQDSLTDGYDIQNWVPLAWSLELRRVQRYFSKTCDPDSLLGATALGVNTGEAKGIVGKAAAASGDMIFWRFPVEMVSTPTVTGFNPVTNSSAHVRQITQAADASAGATITVNNTTSCKVIETSPASSAVGDEIGIHLTADASGTNNEFD
jgi:hypothetical protein